VSNALCQEITPYAKDLLLGAGLRLGESLSILDVQFRIVAVSPIASVVLSVDRNTVVSLVNREERDATLRVIRENAGWPVCFVEGCDFAIGRRCVSCSRFVCPNHSGFCVKCEKIVCHHCAKEGMCEFCYGVLVLGRPRPSVSFMEVLRSMKSYVPALLLLTFIGILFYGESLDSLSPLLRPAVVIATILAGPFYIVASVLRRSKRKHATVGKGHKPLEPA
jgi:hypothetical protein